MSTSAQIGRFLKRDRVKNPEMTKIAAFLKIGILMKCWRSIYAQILRFIKTDRLKAPEILKKLQRF